MTTHCADCDYLGRPCTEHAAQADEDRANEAEDWARDDEAVLW